MWIEQGALADDLVESQQRAALVFAGPPQSPVVAGVANVNTAGGDIGALVAALLLVSGAMYFRRMERVFVDVI